ncbi:MAG TPA: hypothetical protein PK760_00010 [Flavobacteriales bacterium]|nr:hypothetical protein [Flavobacteriales bacterium]
MDRVIDIPEGRLNDYLVHGVFVLIAGGMLFLVHWSLTVVMVALAVGLFRISSGIQIDPVGKRVRVYKALGALRLGSWLRMDRSSGIAIRYTNESQTMGGRGPEITVRVRTYDLHFIGPEGTSWLFHEFTDYAKARKSAETMARIWSMQLTDEIQERRQRAQANAPSRRR